MKKHPYYVYIVRCSDDTLYTGITTDIERRLAEHNGTKPRGARYTSARRPVTLIYSEGFPTRSAALSREYELKHSYTRSEKLAIVKGMKPRIASGVVHIVPADIKHALMSSSQLLTAWNALTPLGRNEWICWTTSVKKAETRAQHVARLCADIAQGKKRPCCWPGCPHREKGQ